jgi:thiamine biosynthesis lipoprotein
MTQSNKSKPTLPRNFRFEALGTMWTVDTATPLESVIRQKINAWLSRYDKAYSRFRDDSIVAAMSRQAGEFTFPAGFADLFRLYDHCFKATNGAMSPLIGAVLEQAGYDKRYSLQPGTMETPPSFADTVGWDGDRTVTTTQPVVFDIGAAGKGQAVDGVAAILERHGVSEYTVDASGDIRHKGAGERIGLELPGASSKVLGVANVRNQSLCASATDRRAWRGVHHMFNANTARPVRDIIATWVVADEAITADGMATALFFVDDPGALMQRYDFTYVRLFANGKVDYSPAFDGELFI